MQLDNSFITDPNMGDLEFLSSGVQDSESGYRGNTDSIVDDSRDSRESEISLLDSSTIMPSILCDEKENTSKVAEQINEMRDLLRQAINNLEVSTRNTYKNDSLLDFAMLMALQSMELMFYRRTIECVPPFAASIERDLEQNEWDRIEQDRVIVNLLDAMGDLILAQG